MNYFIIGFYALVIGASSLAAYYQKRTAFLLLFSLTLVSFVMGIVGGESGQSPALVEQDIAQAPAIAPVALHMVAVVIDLDGMGAVDDMGVIGGQAVPLRMNDTDEGAGVGGAPGQRYDVLAFAGGCKVGWQADGEHMP